LEIQKVFINLLIKFYIGCNLPSAKIEVEEISKILNEENLNTTTLIEKNASKLKILNELNNNEFNLLHFATHGYSLEKKLSKLNEEFKNLGYIQCSNTEKDFKLFATEIEKLNFKNVKLTVLSACESALGKIIKTEGVLGIYKSFIKAGSQSIICTLWSISDEETSKIMIQFYKNLILKNENCKNALRNSLLWAISQNWDFIFWAPFIFIGN
jgi:CHAT domain-containing protein